MKIRNPKNRQGITLLFVISMIVLFLLMGTTFVVISNDYFKAARKRGQANLHEVDGSALVLIHVAGFHAPSYVLVIDVSHR